ncbi:AMP-binding protein [Spirosoma linguale]|uniref:AMP-binding protein n=1 Tax=Spirosoma linguale TaxID=108 RepID=UPI003CC7E847
MPGRLTIVGINKIRSTNEKLNRVYRYPLTNNHWLSYLNQFRPDRLAFVFGNRRLTLAELNQSVNRMANALRSAGIRTSSHVAAELFNCMLRIAPRWRAT